jgi:predicted ATP-dependent serine protease
MPNGNNVTPVEWNTIAEEIIQKKKRWSKANRFQEQSSKAFKTIDSTEVRMDTTDSELNRVL